MELFKRTNSPFPVLYEWLSRDLKGYFTAHCLWLEKASLNKTTLLIDLQVKACQCLC